MARTQVFCFLRGAWACAGQAKEGRVEPLLAMDPLFYKILHLTGIAMVLLPLGGLMMHSVTNPEPLPDKQRRLVAITHGIGMLLILVAAFGWLAKSGMASPSTWGGWVYAKLGIWLFFGACLALLQRARNLAALMWFLLPLVVLVAAYLALYKPF